MANPKASPVWEAVAPYTNGAQKRLEIGAGMRPKFPLEGTVFLESSAPAVEHMRKVGLDAFTHDAAKPMPFENDTFDLVGAFEVLEHIPDDKGALNEVARVLKRGGRFIFSVPVHTRYWSAWDTHVGHQRRYDPKDLERLLEASGLRIESICGFMSFVHKFQKTGLFRVSATAAVFFAKAIPQLFSRLVYDRGFRSLCTVGALKKKGGLVCWNGPQMRQAQLDTSNILVVCVKQ